MKNYFSLKKSFLSIFLSILSLIISLALAEGLTRASGFYPESLREKTIFHEPSVLYGYKGLPNIEAVDISNEFKILVRQNSKGLRGEERSYEKRKGVFRIVVLGDSFMWGTGTEQDKIFTKRLERHLKDEGFNVEVINSGVASYYPSVELLWLKNEGLKYEPDLVLLAFFPQNDIEQFGVRPPYQPYFLEDQKGGLELKNYPAPMEEIKKQFFVKKEAPKFSSLKKWLSYHSALYDLLEITIKSNPVLSEIMIKAGFIKRDLSIEAVYSLYKDYENESWQKSFRWTARIIEEMENEASSQGAEFWTMIVPEKIRIDEGSWKATQRLFLLDDQFNPHAPALAMMQELQRREINVFDLGPSMKTEAEKKRLYLKFNHHWTAAGHESAALAMTPVLAEVLQQKVDVEVRKAQ